MTAETVQALAVIAASIGGVLVAGINAWSQDRQRRALAAAKAAGHTDLMLALGGPAVPTKLPPSGAMVLLILGFSMAAFGYIDGASQRYEAKAGPRNKQCTSAADCDPNQRCERGVCIANAKKLGGPRPQSMSDDADDWALHLIPRSEQLDPYAPMTRVDDVSWARIRVGRL